MIGLHTEHQPTLHTPMEEPTRNMYPVLLRFAERLGGGKKNTIDDCVPFTIYTQALKHFPSIEMMVKSISENDINKDQTEVFFFKWATFPEATPNDSRKIAEGSFLKLRATVTNRGEIVCSFSSGELRLNNPVVINFICYILQSIGAIQQNP